MISRPILSARSRASSLMRTASWTCSGEMLVRSRAVFSRSLLTKVMLLSRSIWDWSSAFSSGCWPSDPMMKALNRPTSSAPATAVPTAAARLLVVPRSEPTSLANSLGEAVTSTLNNNVTSDPWPIPNTTSPIMTTGALQSLRTTQASHRSAIVQRAKPQRPISCGVSLL